MADTVRKRLIDLVETRLNNFSFTTFKKKEDGSIVQPDTHKGRIVFDDTEPLPLIALIPSTDDSKVNEYGNNAKTMPLTIAAIISLTKAEIKDAYNITEAILGELEKALFDDGALQLSIGLETYDFAFQYLGGGVADYPDELGPAVVTIGISSQILFETDIGDPYN